MSHTAAIAQKTKVPPITADDAELKEIMEMYEPNIELFEKDKQAVAKANEYIQNSMPINRDKYGRIILTYGDSLPTIVCSPVVICALELQPGESIMGDVHLGDQVRWVVTQSFSASNGEPVTHLIIKPRDIDIGTTLFIPTDRRSYSVRLVSKKKTYMPRVAFQYPGDEMRKAVLRKNAEEKRVARIKEKNARPKHCNYSISGDVELLPRSVCDDGIKTTIVMDKVTQTLPAMLLQGNDKKTPYKIVNYRVHDNQYIVDRLFTDTAKLVLNTGKHKKEVSIVRMQGELKGVNRIKLTRKTGGYHDKEDYNR